MAVSFIFLFTDLPNGEAITNGVSGGSSGGLIQTVEGGVVTKRSSRIAGMNRKEPGMGESELATCNIKLNAHPLYIRC